ncbi:MAG: PspC domain-containing protein [Lachnospirales bacterium]
MRKKLRLSRDNKMLAGVCGGLGNFFDWDPTIIRLLFAITFILIGVESLIIYIIFWAITPSNY